MRWLALLCMVSLIASCNSKPKHRSYKDDDDDEPRPATATPERVCKKLMALLDKDKTDEKKEGDDKQKQMDDCVREGEKEKADNPANFACIAACADKDDWKGFTDCATLCKTVDTAKPVVAGNTDDFVREYCDCKGESGCRANVSMKYGDALAKTPLTTEQARKMADCADRASGTADDYVKAFCACNNETKCLADAGMKYGEVLAKHPLSREQSKKIADCAMAAASPSSKP